MAALSTLGRRARRLRVDPDGWLSARQVLMVAFVGKAPAAHVCFSVDPAKDGCIVAKLESYGIEPRFCGHGIESQLHRAATERAAALRCEKLRGFRLNSNWC
jgi:GNAT superfamily N-acetyltransferase